MAWPGREGSLVIGLVGRIASAVYALQLRNMGRCACTRSEAKAQRTFCSSVIVHTVGMGVLPLLIRFWVQVRTALLLLSAVVQTFAVHHTPYALQGRGRALLEAGHNDTRCATLLQLLGR